MSEDFTPGWRGLPRYPDPVPGPGVSPRSDPPPPEPSGRQWPIVVAAAVVLVSVAVFAVIGNRVGLPDGTDPSGASGSPSGSTPATPGSSSGAPVPAATAADAVVGFLQAVAAGDLTAALAYSADPAPASPLLSAEVFAAAQRAAPLTDISVPPQTGPSPATTISALYQVGGEPVAQSFGVRQVGDAWLLDQVTADLDLSPLRSGGLPLTVNGVPIQTNVVAALPGAYTFATSLTYVTFAERGVLTVTGPSTQVSGEVGLTVTKEGKDAALAVAKKSFQTCLKVKSVNPKNCPFNLQDRGLDVEKNSITWSVEGRDPFAAAKVTAAGAVASVTITYSVKLTASCAGFSQCSGTDSGTNTGRITLLADPLAVKWLA